MIHGSDNAKVMPEMPSPLGQLWLYCLGGQKRIHTTPVRTQTVPPVPKCWQMIRSGSVRTDVAFPRGTRRCNNISARLLVPRSKVCGISSLKGSRWQGNRYQPDSRKSSENCKSLATRLAGALVEGNLRIRVSHLPKTRCPLLVNPSTGYSFVSTCGAVREAYALTGVMYENERQNIKSCGSTQAVHPQCHQRYGARTCVSPVSR